MKKAFIKNIYQKNSTAQGREELFYQLAQEEAQIWVSLEKKKLSNWTEIFSQKATQYRDHKVIIEVENDKEYSYHELEEASEKIKNHILAHIESYKIGINYHNSFAFMATLIGINKSGRLAILFNNREPDARRETLAKSANVLQVFGSPINGLEVINIEKILEAELSHTPTYPILETTLDEPAFIIFTSGTSGPSKPALFSHRRMVGAGVAWGLRTAMTPEDNCYIPLPLYHGNALAVAFSAVVFSGATAILRPKFSVSSFWSDINRYQSSHMVYIGELWRYLTNSPREDKNPNQQLKVIFGNGLNRPLWKEVLERYAIEHVVEHFGATEMPAGALTNWMNCAGYCGYLPLNEPRLQEMVLVDEAFQPVAKGESGEALFLVPSGVYRGYLDPTLDEPKIKRDLFTQGDVWWRSGDLLKVNNEGFYTFVDRLGDSYRFKGENIACVDVEESIRELEIFEEVVVYGVELPHVEGKIGIASLVTQYPFTPKDAEKLHTHLKAKLASYAMPHILRIQNEKHQTTSTLKIQKAQLAREGIANYAKVSHYILLDRGYLPLTEERYQAMLSGEIILGSKGKR